MAKLTYHGHSTFLLSTDDGTRIVIDPWFEDNPKADIGLEEVGDLDYVFCTHGHSDHFADALPLARRTGATLVSTFEIVQFADEQGIENLHSMSIGGGYQFAFGHVKMVPAVHGGRVHGDKEGKWTTVPGGFLFRVDGARLYHAGDTALLMDMRLLEGEVDVALLPIGDNFTMGPDDAVRAVEFISPRVVVPMHYDTSELIEQDPADFRRRVGDRARVEIMQPGSTLDLG